jgi:hypothetical protein
VGTKREHFEAVWVKNEWGRYLALIAGGAKKTLIPAYQNMTVSDLPEELRHLQAQDLGELGFMQDLLRGIEKILPKKETVAPPYDETQGGVWRKTELVIDQPSKTVMGIAGEPGSFLIIPQEIEAIAPGAFKNIDQLSSLVIEQGKLSSIPEYAFASCKNLQYVTLSDKITSVGNGAFEDCAAIDGIDFAPFKTIGDRAFAGCGTLKDVSFGDNLESLGSEAFAGCDALEQVDIESLKTMGDRIFIGCPKLTSVLFGENVSRISRGAFEGCTALNYIGFDEHIKTIEERAFAGCTSLPKLDYSYDNLRTIKKNAFAGCTKLRSITLPEYFKSLEEGAFAGCAAQESVTISGKASVAPGAFEGCDKIKNIVLIGDKLEAPAWLIPFAEKFAEKKVRIDISDIIVIGDGAFQNCPISLIPLKLSERVDVIGKNAFAGITDMKTIGLPGVTVIDDGAFSGCTGLTRIKLPDSLKVIGAGAFSGCTELKEVTLEYGLKTIGDRAFAGCTGLTHIEIPSSVTSIGPGVFEGCDKLKVILLDGATAELYNQKKITINHSGVTTVEIERMKIEQQEKKAKREREQEWERQRIQKREEKRKLDRRQNLKYLLIMLIMGILFATYFVYGMFFHNP